MNKYCKVSDCRFNNTHTTRNHKCGKCKFYGHGIVECNNSYLINNLKTYYNDIMNDNDKCKFGGCKYSNYHSTLGHHCDNCGDRLHSLFTCPLIINNTNNTNYTNNINTNYEIICPICKTDNKIDDKQSKVYGIDELCIICYEKNQEIFFPKCGHICICIDCCNKMKKKDISNNTPLINYNENDVKNKLKDYPSYTNVYQGMGCFCLFKRLNKEKEIEFLFIHSDDHYTENVDLKIINFINGYACVD